MHVYDLMPYWTREAVEAVMMSCAQNQDSIIRWLQNRLDAAVSVD